MKQNVGIITISGVKNSGKTTFIEKLIPVFKAKGMKVAVIKHDGHSFDPDVPGTDSYRFLKAGADASAVYDAEKYMLTGYEAVTELQLLTEFPQADLILLEGFKDSSYAKLEIIREGNSVSNVCKGDSLKGIITDFQPEITEEVPLFSLEDPERVADFILDCVRPAEDSMSASVKLMLHGDSYFFGPGVYKLMKKIETFGSIRKAAQDMNLSYTKAWKMVNRVEEETGMAFLIRSSGGRQGGSSLLTDEAQQFLLAYEGFQTEMKQMAECLFRKHFAEVQREKQKKRKAAGERQIKIGQ